MTPVSREDPDFQRRVQRILLRPAAERRAALDEESSGDPALRTRLERAVLEAEQRVDTDRTRVDASVPPPSSSTSRVSIADEETLSPGEEIVDGSLRYTLTKRLPGGGLGEVWVAEQLEPVRRRVAIKFIRSDKYTKANEARFDNERRVLAAFDHPNIARFYDAGRHRDRPWFAMEYIEGLPIDAHCERNGLSVEERIKLVQQVARAVQYAHDREIVHRDIKPGNVLVTGEGTPKLLDFGIAKLVGTRIEGQRGITTDFEPHTEEYASPEQLRAQPSTVRSDVYALGVLLYELLTEQLPYHVRTRVRERVREIKLKEPPPPMSEALASVTDESPQPAGSAPTSLDPASVAASSATGSAAIGSSTRGRRNRSRRLAEIAQRRNTRPERLIRRLRGDLDNIVAKAMRIEPLRRYSSPESLAADLENHLQGLPVEARPESTAARLSRILVRNRWVVAGSLVALLALVATLAASYLSVQNKYLESERKRLASQREVLRRAWQDVGTLDAEAAGGIARSSGQLQKLRETMLLLEGQAAALSEVADAGPDGVADWTMLADLRRRLALVADSPASRAVNSGDPVEAARWLEASDAAADSARELAAREGVSPSEAVRIAAQNARERGDLALHRTGDFAVAESAYRSGKELLDRALDSVPTADPSVAPLRRERSTIKTKLGDLLQQRLGSPADLDSLIAARREVVGEYRLALEADGSPRSRVDLAVGLGRLADATRLKGPLDPVIDLYEQSLAAVRPALHSDSSVETRRFAADAMLWLGGSLLSRGAAGDLERGSELVHEATGQYLIQTYRAPEERVAREGILRIQQAYASYLTWDRSVSVLESIRTARLAPDDVVDGLDGPKPKTTEDQLASAVTRAIRIGNGARLAIAWRDRERSRGSPSPSPERSLERFTEGVSEALLTSIRLARVAVEANDPDLSVRVESLLCLAVAGHPDSGGLVGGPNARGVAEAAFADGQRLLVVIGDPQADPAQAFRLAGEVGEAWRLAQSEWADTIRARGESP